MELSEPLSFINSSLGRIRRQGFQILPYALGRFRTVRGLYSAKSRLLQGKISRKTGSTLFPGVDVNQAVRSIREQAVYMPVNLPPNLVAELVGIARTAPLDARTNDTKHHFSYSDVHKARLKTGELVLMGQVLNIQQYPVASRIAEDPVAINVMSEYLGYTPTQWEIRLFWSFASDAPLEDRKRAGQTTQFHFDVHSYNFAYAAYYLLDTTRENGAHVMISGSHKDKPAAWLLGSANQTDEAIAAQYGEDRELVIEGKAGTGFWQDSSCYHKALPPEKSDRLLLQVRYF